MAQLDADAAEKLRKFARRNRPANFKDKFLTQPGTTASPPVVPLRAAEDASAAPAAAPPPAEGDAAAAAAPEANEAQQAAIAQLTPSIPEDKLLLPEGAALTLPMMPLMDPKAEHTPVGQIDTKLLKFDIFDNIDEERLRDFEHHFTEVSKNSNYSEYTKKKKKDPNKWLTVSGVQTEEDGSKTIS
eukprot:TRINITY_DN122601_c0_g1_i1.p1 TRINITY_DN122601_c0_g1~~TRINITY_DN122601_c0_g1_i1.p1  ORF type:complete len:186 (+),score=58.76 TRINITY_DN122601_c0_g1_i1:130-687(+)